MSQKTISTFFSFLPFKPDDYQAEAIDIIDNLDSGENFLATLPTGSGKTLIAEYAIWLAFSTGKRSIYTNPLKALSTEKLNEWGENYLSPLTVMRDTSDDIANRTEENYERFDTLITTNERLNSILRKKKQVELVFKDVEYVVIDEVHLLGSKGRGTTLEYIIMVLQELMPHIKIIGLSATLPNYLEFAEWLKAKYVYLPAEKRPVPLEHCYTEEVETEGWNGRKRPQAQITNDKIIVLQNLIRKHPNEQFLVFVSSRLRTEQLARRVAGIPDNIIPELKDLVKRGAAYHHAGLDEEQRALVEKKFIKGQIKYLFATPTLAQGVNLPAKNVVMFDLKRWSIFTSSHQFIEHYEVGQMAGRAGRRGFDTFGRCFYLGSEDEQYYAKESVENPRPMESRIYESIDDHILALRVSGLVHNQHEIESIFQKSFLHFQRPESDFLIPEEIEFLLKHKFLGRSQHDPNILVPTMYGNLTSKFYVKPRTANEIFFNVINGGEDGQLTEMDIVRAFLKTGEFLLNVRVSDMDTNYINASRQILGLENTWDIPEPVWVTIYNPDSNRHENRDLLNNYMKALGIIFADDLKVQVFGSKKELYSIRKMASEIISKASIVLRARRGYREKIKGIEFKVMIAAKMVQWGKLNPKDVYLLLIDGIGEKRYEALRKARIKTLSDFFTTSNQKLAKILRLGTETIQKMKDKSAEKLPLEQLYKEELRIEV